MGASDTSFDSKGRPETLQMGIHTGMLESMGHNMYTSIGKCLAEFIANAYDADAKKVTIDIPFSEINSARQRIRGQAKKEFEDRIRSDISSVYDPLPEEIKIIITDDGHGMDANELQKKFLIVNRDRRKDGNSNGFMSESGNRYVMGRKGIGKLAGFGAAQKVIVESKRAGENYVTTFEMDFENIQSHYDLREVFFKPIYSDVDDEKKQYTKITLLKLRCDSLKAREENIKSTFSRTFSILGTDFQIILNGEEIVEENISYEYIYPEGLKEDEFSTSKIKIDDIYEFDIQYKVKFRSRASDSTVINGSDDKHAPKVTSLPATQKGARIYCNGRLAAGPSLLGIHSGVHNFQAQNYMECIVLADQLDRLTNDYVGTNRSDLQGDNEIVEALYEKVTEHMKAALAAHYRFRQQKTAREVDDDPDSKKLLAQLSVLPKRTQRPAKRILQVLASEHGVKSDVYKEMAPIMLSAVNAGEVITNLIKLETDPKSIQVISHQMAELALMEKNDVLKLYRARRSAIIALEKLHDRSLNTTTHKGYENELHSLLKENPWLVRPEFSGYLTSDSHMGDVCRKINELIKIDIAAAIGTANYNDKTRPDLVFSACNTNQPDQMVIVELKSPGIPLEQKHFTQLETYIVKVKRHLENDLSKPVNVVGYLIGTKPKADTSSDEQMMLLDKIKNAGANDRIKIISILELLTNAKTAHNACIEALEAEEKELADDLS
ncbi:ATP-binding protein [Aeromonas caviae]|uniref:ATP-binding protein n=1 Tax=Aeromonas TaxID=642 RepID=UPI001EF132A4|nr:ATP-binding protein [Aeromonas caviae]ULH02225.1 ATP-binding protein [Aeromonas caviae]